MHEAVDYILLALYTVHYFAHCKSPSYICHIIKELPYAQ